MNRLPSVTQILGCLDKPGLSWAAARETAVYAANHLDEWCALPTPDAVTKLYRYHRGLWDHRAALGTAVHQVNEAWARGDTVDLVQLVKEGRESNRIWQTREPDDLYHELAVMVDGLERAWQELQPETISVEDVVRYPGGGPYIGTSDWRCKINGQTWLVDVKTTAETDPTKAFYWSDWRLQLAAYRYCTEKVHYAQERVHRPYAKGIEETGTSPLEPVDGTAVLHLRANGEWAFLPVQAGPEEHMLFLELRKIYGWLQLEGKKPGVATWPGVAA